MKIFETHAHLDFPEFDPDREQVIRKSLNAGVEFIINIGIDEATSRASIKLADTYPQIYAAVAYHPHEAKHYNPELIRSLSLHPQVVAIGETGLDYYRNHSPREVQKQVFRDQAGLASELGLPLIIHDRDAHADCLQILDEYQPAKVVFHCFSGDVGFASQIIERNWFISITGNITYRNQMLEDVVRYLPLNRLFIETDCPFLTPCPFRGKRNSPEYLPYTISRISELKGITPRQVAEATFDNAFQFFLGERIK
ncbi:MAG: TatD family hydrolase [Candidatus Cloacimonetes bacterium]|nr:TatD family hydrolase [Candidatus Cloacimonadota bacterium]